MTVAAVLVGAAPPAALIVVLPIVGIGRMCAPAAAAAAAAAATAAADAAAVYDVEDSTTRVGAIR